MSTIRPYIIVPNLIEQPTWGGDYIRDLKKITSNQIGDKKIGQSYELYRDTYLSQKKSTSDSPTLEIADPNNPTKPERVSVSDEPFHISELIQVDPEKTLGQKAIEKDGHSIEVLIKLNHARGNSYQVHAKTVQPDSRWLPKPESWYYLEPGLVSLGVKEGVDWDAYKHTCELIEKESQLISSTIINGDIDVETGRKRLSELIEKHNPQNYVNLVSVARNSAIDLSKCGIHHSWEQDIKLNPLGNVVYEVQKNVYDPDCTIRAFDKGKIKDDGTIREVHVDDYFHHLDRDPDANKSESHYTKGKILKKTSSYTVKEIFETEYYKLKQLTFKGTLSNQYTKTNESYQHLFVRRGVCELVSGDTSLTITEGFSAFIPASTDTYTLKSKKSTNPVVLITSV